MGKTFSKMFFVIAFVFGVLSAGTAIADITNGDFSTAGLSGWTAVGTVSDGGGYAFFEEDPFLWSSSLSQEFVVPDLALELSFDVVMDAQGTYDPFAWPDAFTASLYDNPLDLNPLVQTTAFSDDFFYMDHTGFVDTVADFDGLTVRLDVSGFRGMGAYLVFDLWGYDDGVSTTVDLDNVEVSVVPAPGALLLGVIGIGTVGTLRRSRIGKSG